MEFVAVTTYRRTGAPVATPVWTVPEGTDLLVWTDGGSGKVKRIRHTPRVTVAPSDARGRVQGETRTGTAEILPADRLRDVERLFTARYGLAFRGMRTATRLKRAVNGVLRRPTTTQVAVRIRLDDPTTET